MPRSSTTQIRRETARILRGRPRTIQKQKGIVSIDSAIPRQTPINGQATQFVWFYIPGPENCIELKLSIRSIEKNFIGTPQITVVGEKPVWYSGHFIPIKRFSGIKSSKPLMPFRDTQHKLVSCVGHPEIDEEFVWIMDDTFMLKPTSIEELRIPRYDPWYQSKLKSPWHRLIGETFGILRKHGKPTLQYATHLPHVFTKTNLQDMFEQYQYPRNLYLFENLYENTFKTPNESLVYAGKFNGVEYPSFLSRHLRPKKLHELDKVDANFMNYPAVCWNSTLKNWIEQKLDMK